MKKMIICSLAAVSFFAAGCVDYEENLVINKDRSGTVQMRYSVEKVYLKQMQAIADMMAESTKENTKKDISETMFSRAEIEDALKSRNSGINLLSYETSEDDKTRTWQMMFSFGDVDSLAYLFDILSSDMGEYAPAEDTVSVYARLADGTWLFSRPLVEEDLQEDYSGYDDADTDDYLDEEYSEDDESIEEISDEDPVTDTETDDEFEADFGADMGDLVFSMGEHTIKINVTFPGRIVETNATSTEGSTATWEYGLDRIQEAPSEMKAIIAP